MEKRSHSDGNPNPNVGFGPFELDLRVGELRKGRRRIRLQEQPLQILRILLESPGEVVSREEIRKRLWPDNTVVEFDHSINAAVKRLRDALRDSAEKPRYIETVARRGYRFIGEIDTRDGPRLAEVTVIPENNLTNRQAEWAPRRPALHLPPRIFVPFLLAAIILMIWAGLAYYRRGFRPFQSPLLPLVRLDVDLGSDVSPESGAGAKAILSLDGTRLVYISHSKLFTRLLDQPNVVELPGTENAQAPFFSPDGQWVAFFATGRLKKVSLRGGPAMVLCDCPLPNGGSWGNDGSIIATCNFTLARISSAGGAPSPVTELAPGEIVHRWPQILPGGKAVLFTAYPSVTGSDGANIEVLSFKEGRPKMLVRGGTFGRYVPSGHLIYINKGTLFASAFDLKRLEVRGMPTPVLEDVAYSAAWGSGLIDFTQTGTLVYRSSKVPGGLVTVQWLDDSGNTRPLLPVPGNYLSPTLSPDGSRLALTSAGDIWVYELGHGSMTRLTFGAGYGNPLWSADGRYILFRAARGMLWTRADGTVQPQLLTQSSNQQTPWSFTPDGKRLAFVELDPATGADIWTVPVETSSSGLRAGKPEVFLQTPFHERGAMFSPDGRWLAYLSNESGTYQIYVQAFPQKNSKRQISTERGTFPAWSRNGTELFFWQFAPENQLMAVSYKTSGDAFIGDRPRVWSKKVASFSTTRSYDPAPDGKHIVALTPADTPQEPHDRVVFLLNFFDELRRRVPRSK
jgi:DNA-binding winged helix-turn-helix (wHTH) protein/Tol biopolymer transport system component